MSPEIAALATTIEAGINAAYRELWQTYGDGSASGARITAIYAHLDAANHALTALARQLAEANAKLADALAAERDYQMDIDSLRLDSWNERERTAHIARQCAAAEQLICRGTGQFVLHAFASGSGICRCGGANLSMRANY
jgi:hypothetical protein